MRKTLKSLLFIVVVTLISIIAVFTASAEAGDSYSYAQAISTNTTYTDNISKNNDQDYFKITLPYDGYIYFNFKRENLFDANEYWTITLLNQNAEFITDYSVKGNKTEDNTYKIGLAAGTYYIRIRGGNWYYDYSKRFNSINYNLTIKYTQSSYWEKENNKDYSTANSIALNKKYGASLIEDYDIDYYKITLPSAGYINFNFKRENLFDANEYWTITLLNQNAEFITDYSVKGNETEDTTYKIGLSAGTYYIMVRGGNWYYDYSKRHSAVDYNLTVMYEKSTYFERENNEEYSTANNISLNQTYTASLCEDYDIDYYKFTVSERMNLTVKFKSSAKNDTSEYYTLALFDSATNELLYTSIYGDKVTTTEKIALNKGTYFIRIRAGNWYYDYGKKHSSADYSFSVSITPPGITSSITATQSTSAIRLNWNKVDGATGYRVYQYSPSKGKYVQIASVKTTTYKKATNLKPGTTYKFKIKAHKKLADGTVIWGSASSAFATATECKAPKITSVTSPSKAKATVKWSNVDGETGFQLYYSTKKDSGFKKIDSYSANKLTASKTFSASASGKTIYFKVRAYKKVGGQTIYSDWSAVKSVKLK